ncbi:MAG TPA: ABC transporter ATP-binding protein [Solirubrobacteraceae bacterium]
MTCLLRVRGLTKTVGAGRVARCVLDGVDVDVAAGELVAVVGPSGSGKSTLLHLAGGLDEPDAGDVEIAGTRLRGRSDTALARLRARHLGFVFQAFHLVPELSGEENVRLAARFGRTRTQARARAAELIDAMGLRAVAGSHPAQLSGGEQRRFAVARALVNDPVLVLADEPTGNLDAESGALVLSLLRAATRHGRGVLVVTHDPAVTTSADRVLALSDGHLR